ncbi:MAG TPA: hypothetical protein PK878_02695 [bacterium]|nr:hypothetical protein [bacterium]HOL92733.1 hypothetical protein [bacterium]HPO99052.1 hypothetical protein [bacterium]HXK92734.1 hypothetical protein [bacterium]
MTLQKAAIRLLFGTSRHHNQGHCGKPAAQNFNERQAIHPGHLQIGNDQIKAAGFDPVQGISPVACGDHRVFIGGKTGLHGRPEGTIIIHNQYREFRPDRTCHDGFSNDPFYYNQ